MDIAWIAVVAAGRSDEPSSRMPVLASPGTMFRMFATRHAQRRDQGRCLAPAKPS